ncbi:hypothetical protein A2686_03795 [Candidatus Woesebacteria bacterium RIFCSPHIGHO2_01_FULL_38_10]|uniref:Ribulose-phosphate 3-epimerase n=1 Tax=Candidatus Woesebacteria bacterium RIFCSPLOWO2_01_FULL_39_10b TaxID=1802517 RepID=A0A1F8B759_9BACT|nr:MAG: hypothetical protein A2686_03795 [Candidatus Woesebacteria bacterium RIFCSPHIGHO2_01_FULL_38_10]OGM59886.1 MAG: hypothetical protein A2892_02790 [Candidatus Woesebacteria bacterium RIFCSPLOWO2_01_FULL_39_10b]
MIDIIPSILTNDPKELREMLTRCKGVVKRVSIDIIDGKFVNNKTVDPSFLSNLDTNLKIDYQLMVLEPINWIKRCVRGQADRIIGHIEKMSNQAEFIAKVQEAKVSTGLALDIATPVARLDATILNELDVILLMAVPSGFGGHSFDQRVLEKINRLAEVRAEKKRVFKIHVDGGITSESIYNVYRLGANEVSVGRLLFAGDLAENIKRFRKVAYKID